MNGSQMIRQHMNGLDWAMLIVLSVTWGLSFIFMEVAVRELPVFTVVALRVGLAAVALNIFLLVKKQTIWTVRSMWRGLFFMALFGHIVPFSLFVWAHMHINASLASIFNACVPFFTVFLAHALTGDERFKASKIFGVMLGVVGVVIIIGPYSLLNMNKVFLAQAAMLLAVGFYAWVTVYARRFTNLSVPSTVIATGQLTLSTLIIVPLALILEQPWTLSVPSMNVVMMIVGLGIISTAFAFVLYYHLIGRVGATNTSLVTFLVPVNTIWIGTLYLNESLQLQHMLGMAFIAMGLIVIDARLYQRLIKH